MVMSPELTKIAESTLAALGACPGPPGQGRPLPQHVLGQPIPMAANGGYAVAVLACSACRVPLFVLPMIYPIPPVTPMEISAILREHRTPLERLARWFVSR